MVDSGCSRSVSRSSRNSTRNKSYLDLISPAESYEDLSTLHNRRCKKYFCLCKRHIVSVICLNETRKLYWFNSCSVEEKVRQGLGEGYYNKLLRIVNGALSNYVQRYLDGLGEGFKKNIMLKINGSAKSNMKLLKEGCYCHYHPHLAADVCNANFLRRVVSRRIKENNQNNNDDDDDDFDALTPGWMVHLLLLALLSYARFFFNYSSLIFIVAIIIIINVIITFFFASLL